MKKEFNIATKLLLEECKKRGGKIETIYPGLVAKIDIRGHIEYTYNQYFSTLSAVANRSCANKAITREFLKLNTVSVADGREFSILEQKRAIEFAKSKDWNIVLKPTDGGKGDCVFSNINNLKEFLFCWDRLFKKYKTALLEKKFEGKEYRILATREKVLAITYRKPANVVGDGEHTIKELIDDKNSDPRRSDDIGDPVVKIIVDDVVLNKLKAEKKALSDIPFKGEVVYLRDNSNISTGGESIDFTDIAHPDVKANAIKAVQSIPGLLYAGVDYMTNDISCPQDKDNYIIVEINSSPGFDLHHFPYEGRPRNVTKDIIDLIFPETINNK